MVLPGKLATAHSIENGEKSMRSAKGFTYLAVLIFVALMGMGLATICVVWSTTVQRERERELLRIGKEIRTAIGQYYLKTPGVIKRYPARLQDLLMDERQLAITRYLRKIENDPFTGKPDWGLIPAPDGGVMGVFSRSNLEPTKRFDRDNRMIDFGRSRKYSEWRFYFELTNK